MRHVEASFQEDCCYQYSPGTADCSVLWSAVPDITAESSLHKGLCQHSTSVVQGGQFNLRVQVVYRTKKEGGYHNEGGTEEMVPP